MKNHSKLIKIIEEHSESPVEGYVCIGYGSNPDIHTVYDIPCAEIHLHNDEDLEQYNYGSSEDHLYYITQAFFDKNIQPKYTRGELVSKGEGLIGKIVKGELNPFVVETVNLYNKGNNFLPSWLPDNYKDLINEHGFIVTLENEREFTLAAGAVELSNVLVLNSTYKAIIEGDIVKVGCQEIPTDKVIELANLINILKSK